MKKEKLLSIVIASSVLFTPISSSAHPGRTDSSGGHKDNQNKSGLGYYHYHCGGNPAHLHKNGCPYGGKSSSSKTKTTKSKSSGSTKSNSNLKKVQEKLNSLGYDCGKADGINGTKTKNAIKSFQKAKGLTADGIAGKKTLKSLGL